MGAEARAEFYRHMDAANVDLKGFTEDCYRQICSGHLQPVLETLEYLKHETSVWFEITSLLIPGANDSDAGIDAMSAMGGRAPGTRCTDALHGLPPRLEDAGPAADAAGHPHPRPAHRDCQRRPVPVHRQRLRRPCRLRQTAGRTTAVVPGNPRGNCGTPCSGVFEGPPGSWGRLRLPVLLGP